MGKRTKWLSVLLGVVMLGSMLAACSKSSTDTAATATAGMSEKPGATAAATGIRGKDEADGLEF